MPPYASLAEGRVDLARTADKLHAMKSVGVPYTDAEIASAADDARAQADAIASDLRTTGADVAADSDLVALIAYLQRLGVKPAPAPSGTVNVTARSLEERRGQDLTLAR
jgi:cytochrome c oxidase cbb3-type subunit I/II